jgi:hypothetical protein
VKIIFKYLIINLLAACLACGDEHAKLNRLMAGGQAKFTEPVDTLRFEWADSLLWVRAQVLAQGVPTRDLRLLVATEMPTALLPAVARELGCQPAATFPLADDQGQPVARHYALLPDLWLGRTAFVGTGTALLHDSVAQWLGHYRADGVLGANLMQHAVWLLDFEAQHLLVAPSEQPFAGVLAGAHAVPFIRDVWRSPKFQVGINQFPRRPFVRLSTGLAGGLKLSHDWYDDRPSMFFAEDFPATITDRNVSGLLLRSRLGQPDTTFWAETKQLEINRWFVTNAPTQLRRDQACRLGLGVLRRYRVVINWQRRVLYLAPLVPSQGL